MTSTNDSGHGKQMEEQRRAQEQAEIERQRKAMEDSIKKSAGNS